MNLEQKIVGDLTGDYLVEAYQRGYRWSDDEIKYLLEDINELKDGQKYCLQPIVVKNKNGVYELIDGQQRLTTLFLIMKYLSAYMDLNYHIEYTTRKSKNGHIGSRELLENIENIDPDSPSNNIDELFIKNAFKYIKDWFGGDKKRMISYARKLQNDITIIWYEVDDNENSIAIFTRLNIGKINLTNAELVKALFLSRGNKDSNGFYSGNPYGIDEKRQHEIALEWDTMEKGLHNKKFWSFITNEDAEKYPIRMELFFDIMENKPTDESNFYTFHKFYERFKDNNNKFDAWETIVRYYQQLKEWYEDFDLYHQIGYLISNGTNVKDLLDLAMNQEAPLKKSEFKNQILQMIRDSVVFEKKDGDVTEELDYAELNYESHKPYLHTLLLLFNVETIRQKGDENNRFPFERYKSHGTWSLEHIHAQNSESLKTNKDWRNWLVLHKQSLLRLEKTIDKKSQQSVQLKDTIKEIDEVVSHIDDTNYKGSIRDEFAPVAQSVIDFLTDGDDKTQMHTISNMALLTVGENAALNNSTFDVKRAKIIEMDKNGDYIPACTKNVFMKYYSTSDTKLQFWSDEDRRCYVQAMNDVLYHFKKESDDNEIKLIKTEIHYGNNK